jgi:periplasmic protein TonB
VSAAVLLAPAPLPDSRRLWTAVGISIAIHSLLLALHFQFPDASRAMQEKALDIILVNAKSARKPANAQALAQTHLDGGGNTDEDRRARTPLPPTQQQVSGSELEQAQRRVKELEAQQQQVLTQARSIRAAAVARSGQDQPQPSTVSGFDLAESARAMARLEGEINKSVDEYNRRPRKKFLGTRAEEYALAPYLDAWKQKIERIGTLNYPDAARGRIYGAVVIYVELRADDGSLYNAEISRSSGHKVLDEAALRILRMAAPFGPIPREALGGATVLSFARTWQFTQGDAFNTAVAK